MKLISHHTCQSSKYILINLNSCNKNPLIKEFIDVETKDWSVVNGRESQGRNAKLREKKLLGTVISGVHESNRGVGASNSIEPHPIAATCTMLTTMH